jgi:DNA-directed RNA polymerase subunit K/omega
MKDENLYFSLKKLIDFKGNRYELARAAMEYAKKVRYLETDEYHKVGEKDALVALRAVLEGDIKYTLDEQDIVDDMDDELEEYNPQAKAIEAAEKEQ